MSKRRIKPKIIPGFVYESPKIHRNAEKKTKHNEIVQERTSNLNTSQETHLQPELEPNLSQSTVQPSPEANPETQNVRAQEPRTRITESTSDTARPQPNQNDNLDDLLSKIYKHKDSPVAYSAAVQKFIDRNYSLSLHKQRRKRFR